MNEDVASAHFVQQVAFSRLIEKGDYIPGKGACTPEEDSQGEVLKKEPALQPHFFSRRGEQARRDSLLFPLLQIRLEMCSNML